MGTGGGGLLYHVNKVKSCVKLLVPLQIMHAVADVITSSLADQPCAHLEVDGGQPPQPLLGLDDDLTHQAR